MRYVAYSLFLIACSNTFTDETDQSSGDSDDDKDEQSKPDEHPVDACDDAPTGFGFVFETGNGGMATNGALEISTIQMVGARFTTTQTYTITELGALVRTSFDQPQEIVIAVVPLGADGYPMNDLSNAIGFATGIAPAWEAGDPPPGDTTLTTSFTLPPGTYGLVVGSDRLGAANNEALLPAVANAVGDPDFFVYHGDFSGGPYWSEAQTSMAPRRLVIRGN